MTVGLLLTALGLGLRHGIDWDHIAAIADLSSTAESRRKGVLLSTLYAVGHAVVVLVLGGFAIVFGASLPEGVDVWMGRVVGATLIALGLWVLVELIRKGRDFRLRSRWILVLGGTFAGLRRVREARATRRVSIQHNHVHDHVTPHGKTEAETVGPAHDHAHIDLRDNTPAPVEQETPERELEAAGHAGHQHRGFAGLGFGFGSGRRHRHGHQHGRSHQHSPGHTHQHRHTHQHPHTHELALAEAAGGTGNGTAAGIGVLHGIGFESPTQIAVFVASTSLVGAWAGVSLLVAWVLGLVIANTFLAILAAYGLLGAERNFTIYATIAVFVALVSLAMGLFLVFGVDPPLPEL